MLAGRLIQGLGGGMLLALSYVAIQMLFPRRLWTRLFAIESLVWGAAALFGPLIGGLFADARLWRGAFWAFAAQSGLLSLVVIAWMPKATAKAVQPSGWSVVALLMLFVATILIAQAGVTRGILASSALGLTGLALLYGAARLDGASQPRLLPRQLLEPWHTVGAGLLMVFAMSASTVAFWAYGPLILKAVFGVDTLVIGYILAAESIAWTVSTMAVSGVRDAAQPAFIRSGVALVAAGASGFIFFLPIGSLPGIVLCVLLQGMGFGLSWPFLVGRIVAHASPGEQALAASAAPTIQRVGYAVGAAATGVAANAAGLAEGVTIDAARSAAFWVFAAFIPLLIVANLAAHRFTAAD